MSESREASYYEIALTNRQVLFAFVILLVCLLGAFISGVWVGRGGETAAAAGPVATTEVAEAGAEGAADDGLQKMSFFGEERPAGSPPAAAPANGGAGTTLRDDLGAGGARKAEPAPEVSSPEPEPEPAAPAASPPAAATPAPARAEPAAATPARPAPEPAATSAAPADGPVVQVFSSRDQDQAQKVVDRLNRGGHPAYLSPIEVNGSTMYRVRLGPYADRAEAQRVADRVRHDFKLDTWITQ